MSRASVRRQLKAIRAELRRQGRDRPLFSFDQLAALPSDAPERGTDEEGQPLVRIDWDSLAQSDRPHRDPTTIIPPASLRLQEIAAAVSAFAGQMAALPKNGFVEVQSQQVPTQGEPRVHDDP